MLYLILFYKIGIGVVSIEITPCDVLTAQDVIEKNIQLMVSSRHDVFELWRADPMLDENKTSKIIVKKLTRIYLRDLEEEKK